jgi:hypothetical protein
VKAIAGAANELVEQRDQWLNPPNAEPHELAKLTLTNLYNKRPRWLENAHHKLDRAFFAAYGWPNALTDQQILEWLLALNQERTSEARDTPSYKTMGKGGSLGSWAASISDGNELSRAVEFDHPMSENISADQACEMWLEDEIS